MLKTVLLLTAFSLLFGVVGVHAQQGVAVWFDPELSQVNVGETTTVKLMVDAQNAVNSFDLTFEYDPNVVLLDRWTYGGFLSKLSALKNEATPGRLWLVSVQLGAPPVAGTGVLLEFTLRGVAAGESTLGLPQVKFADASGNQYTSGVTNGRIAIQPAMQSTATSPVVNTSTPTATQTMQPITMPTANLPLPTATQKPTATLQAPAATRTAPSPVNPSYTTQPGSMATPRVQQATLPIATAAQSPLVVSQTLAANPILETQSIQMIGKAPNTFTTSPTPKKQAITAVLGEKLDSISTLTLGIIVFDIFALDFILFLLLRRRRKKTEKQL
jgi:hypothetical protein